MEERKGGGRGGRREERVEGEREVGGGRREEGIELEGRRG